MENKTPKLRFPEFKGEWEKKKLGEVAQFSKGKGISKADITENGEFECIRYGELYTVYGETIDLIKSRTNIPSKDLVFSESNDVIIPASGETQIDIATASCVLKSGIALGGDLNIIKSNKNGVFLSYYLNSSKKKEIANLAQGISVVHLYSSQLALLNLNFPSLPEQTKIASFLTVVDKKISELKKEKSLLEQYKKGAMQQIFSQKLRFKPSPIEALEIGNAYPDWEEKRLGEIGETYNGLTGKTKENFGFGKPYIQYKQIFDNSQIDMSRFEMVDISENEKQNKVKFGDVFFTVSSETPKEIGMSSVLLDNVEELYLNSFCFGYRANSLEILSPYFSRYLFRSEIFRTEIIKLAQGSTRYNMSKVELMKLKINLPSLPEQTKIASFLSSIDKKISDVDFQLEKIVVWKKGLLQQLFV
ncbi:MAG: restriction endonuclease subunit S [Flavobacteriales bacterium]|nr:restriction endonuclease subunit S [Flavobacteriales bacterium]